MNNASLKSYTAFVRTTRIASGDLPQVASRAKAILDRESSTQPLIFDDDTSCVIEVDFRGSLEDVLERITRQTPSESPSSQMLTAPGDDQRRPGRPKIGVVSREVSLLPRHWEWLASQPGGASVALRKLVEQARITNQGKDRQRRSQDSTYRFLSTMAGNEPHFEEAVRALFGADRKRFDEIVGAWPVDIAEHARKSAVNAFEISDAAPGDAG